MKYLILSPIVACVTFSLATLHDIKKLEKLVNSAYRGDSSKKGWTTEADLLGGIRVDEESLRLKISAPNTFIILLIENEKILGCVLLENKGEVCYLGMLTVDPSMQNARLGRQILDYAESWAKEKLKSNFMEMTVIHSRKELLDWYYRRGYVFTGEMRPFPYEDEKFGIPKVENLDFMVLSKKIL